MARDEIQETMSKTTFTAPQLVYIHNIYIYILYVCIYILYIFEYLCNTVIHISIHLYLLIFAPETKQPRRTLHGSNKSVKRARYGAACHND